MLAGVLLNGIDNVKRLLSLDIARFRTLTESDAVHHIVRLAVNQFQFDVFLLTPHHLARSIVKHILRAEKRFGIFRSIWTHAFEVIEELRCDVLKVDDSINVKVGTSLLRIDVLMHISLKTSAELPHILHLHRQTCRIGVTAKIVQQILTTLNGSVHVKSAYAPCTARHDVAIQRQHHSRAEEFLGQSRSHNANHALMPIGIVYHDGTLILHARQLSHHLTRLLRHALVQFLALLIIVVDGLRHLQCLVIVTFNEQIHRLLAVLHTSARIDARTNLEDDVTHRQILTRQSTHLQHSLHTRARIVVQLLQTMICQDAVLTHDGHDVARDADSTQVQQRYQPAERNAIADGKSLHELEAHATTRQIKIRIRVVHPFGIQNRHCRRQHLVRHMVVADDEVNALVLGILNFIDCLDATIQHNHQFHTLARRIINSFHRNAISLLAAVGDITFHIGVVLRDTSINQRYRRTSIHIVVTINHDAFTLPHRLIQTLHCLVHIFH